MLNKQANTQVEIHELIANRWSGRAFDKNKPVSKEQIIALLEASRWSPSCYSDQPWHYIVFDKFQNEHAWRKAQSTIVEKNLQWAQNAPVLILTTAAANFRSNDKPNKWAEYDTGASVLNLSLQASAMDLVCHQMGGYDSDKARDLFNIPEQYHMLALVAIGHRAPVTTLNKPFNELEIAERSRHDLGSRYYLNNWGNSIQMP